MTLRSKVRDRRIEEIRHAIDENPLLDLEELQIKAKLGRSRLDELFMRQVGVPLGDYVRERRLSLAAKLLETSDLRSKEIAHRIGYEHSSSFARSFKLFFGVSPSDYRRSHREKS